MSIRNGEVKVSLGQMHYAPPILWRDIGGLSVTEM